MNLPLKLDWDKAFCVLLLSLNLGHPLLTHASWSMSWTTNGLDGDYTNSMAWFDNELVGGQTNNSYIYQDSGGEAQKMQVSYIDATVSADDSGLSVSATNFTLADVYVDGDAPVDPAVNVYSISSIKLGAGYSWVGSYGYPTGPERFPISLSLSADGTASVSGLLAGNTTNGVATAGAAYVGSITTSPSMDGEDHGSPSWGGSAQGACDHNTGTAEVIFYGDSAYTNDFHAWEYSFSAAGGSGYSVEEDYLIDTAGAAPPDLTVVMQLYSESAAGLHEEALPIAPGKVAESDGTSFLEGSVSWSFGRPY